MTAGITAGIAAVAVPIAIVLGLIRYFGAHHVLKKFRLESEHWIENKVEENQQAEQPVDGTGTPPFV